MLSSETANPSCLTQHSCRLALALAIVHNRNDGALAWPGHAGVCLQRFQRDHKNRVGHISVRHMCDDGVLSKPSPSFGCLKLRPMMSMKSSRLTLALGSNE